MIGILAYGSLISNPGEEIKAATHHIIQNVETPFEVEYARSSKSRAGAPTLVPVPAGIGGRLRASLIVLNENVNLQAAKDMLYRREINQIGSGKEFADPDPEKKNKVIIRALQNALNLKVVLYTDITSSQETKIAEIFREDMTPQQKANKLVELAVSSLKKETFESKRDGIQYLADNISAGIVTPLTNLYQATVLKKADYTHDLAEARIIIAREKGIIL